jgi:hypothetical protein
MDSVEYGAPERIRTTNLLIRSQMLYPVELRAPFEEQLICGGRARRSNNAKENEKFPAAFEIRYDLLTQGYGIDRAKSSTLRSTGLRRYAKHGRQESTGAESSARASPTNELPSVYSRNSPTTEQL